MNVSTDEVAEPKRTANHTLEERTPTAAAFTPVTAGRRRRPLIGIVLLATALALGFGLWSLCHRLAPQITAPPSAESAYVASFPEKSIAVLPFEHPGKAEKSAALAAAVEDEIITALSKVGELRVISRTSVRGYLPGEPRHLREIAQSLGAGHILEGKASCVGDKARITVRLTDARKGVLLWKASYERPLDDVFGIQTDLLQRIATPLHATISPQEKAAIDGPPTRDLAAYSLYLRGKTLLENVSSAQVKEKLLQAVETLDQAIARDPNFYLAWCQLAAAHDYIYFFGFDHTPARLALAERALKTAVRLRPEAGETHLAKATFLYRCHLDYDGAWAELAYTQRALPNNSEAFELAGYIDRRQSLWKESARSLQHAVELDPRNAFLLQEIAFSYQEFREFRAMAAALDRALALAPHDLDLRIARALVDLEWRADTRPLHQTIAAILAENPDAAHDVADQWFYVSLCERNPAEVARALAALPETGISTDLNFPRSYCQALAARARGDAAAAQSAFLAARAVLEKTVREQPDYGPSHTVLGLIDAGLGRKEEALREGRRGVEMLPIAKNSLDGAELMKYLGVIYAWCGEKDLAIAQIDATLRIPSTLSYGNFKLHPYWDPLRGDPRFEKIVADLAPKNLEK